jgi:hypothetical protein
MTTKSATATLLASTGKALASRDRYKQDHGKQMTFGVDGPGAAIACLTKAWACYADAYAKEFGDSKIGDDGVLGDAWAKIGSGIIDLLNGPTGKLDCGTLDSIIREIARQQNCEEEL